MGRLGRPMPPLTLTAEERETLLRYTRRSTLEQRLAERARMVLLCADGLSNIEVGRELGVSDETVGKWRARFVAKRLDGLHDEPRPGAPRQIGDDEVEAVVIRTLETTPKDATHWSTRSMAKHLGLSQSTISRIWRAFSLKPHRSETFAVSKDPLLIEKVRDIVGLYMNPPDNAVVLCVDEKSQIQALNRTQPLLPLKPGQVERRTHDYERHGTTSLFAALEIRTGRVFGKCFRRHRAREFLAFLKQVDASVSPDQDVHVVLDNYSTHKTPTIQRWLAKHPRFRFHFTPTKGSWLNMVESWFSALTRRQITRGSHTSVKVLEAAIGDYLAANNEAPKPFVWTKPADVVLAKIARFCRQTLQAHGAEQ